MLLKFLLFIYVFNIYYFFNNKNIKKTYKYNNNKLIKFYIYY